MPVAIALDASACNAWTAASDGLLCGVYCGVNLHGAALLVAIHEAMHAKYADGDEAVTECRAVQTFPGVMSSLFPGLAIPGRKPAKPKRRADLAPYRAALARWQAASALRNSRQEAERAMTSDAHADDTNLPGDITADPASRGQACRTTVASG